MMTVEGSSIESGDHWPPGMLCREQRTVLTTATMVQTRRHRTLLERTLSLTTTTAESSDSVLFNFNNIAEFLPKIFVDLMCGEKDSSDASGVIRSRIMRNRRTFHWHLRRYGLRLRELFTWFIVLGLMQSTCAAPLQGMNGQVTGTPPKWINPCGMSSTDVSLPSETDMPFVSDQDLLSQIIVQAKNAFADANAHKDEYVKKTFKVNFDEHNEAWKHSNYNWLPNKDQIPKVLGEKVSVEHLQSIKNLNDALAITYEYMQRFAAGLEQVSRDQCSANGEFKDLFNSAEYKLRALLCEIQVAMIERGTVQHQDITRDIISVEQRNLDLNSQRNLRDWVIYRDYMNALEYVIQVFEHFCAKLQ